MTNATYEGENVGSRTTTTAQCSTDYTATYSGTVSCSNFVALLGYTADNGVLNLPTSYNLPTNAPIKSVSGTTYASNFSNLISNTMPLFSGTGFTTDAGVMQTWSGFSSTGTVSNNCAEWVSTGSGENSRFLNGMNDAWDTGSSNCGLGFIVNPYLCLCW